MADRRQLTNDSTQSLGTAGAGTYWDEEVFNFYISSATETSALAASAALVPVAGPMKANGRIVDFVIGIAAGPAVSASGFVSANISANLRINSVSCLSTIPAIIGPATSAGAAGRLRTNNIASGTGVSAVVNAASAVFSAGDMLAIDYTGQSTGSAAAGAAAAGLYVQTVVRYAAT